MIDARKADHSPRPMRQRLIDGMAGALVEKTFPRVTVADVVRHPRTSRRTFYEHFDSRDDCFVALHDALNKATIADIAASVDRSAPVAAQVRQAVEAWISSASARPELTVSWIRDSHSLPVRGSLVSEAQNRFVSVVRTLVDSPAVRGGREPLPTAMIVVLIGGLRELIASQVESGEPMADIVDVAVTASLALIGSRCSRRHP